MNVGPSNENFVGIRSSAYSSAHVHLSRCLCDGRSKSILGTFRPTLSLCIRQGNRSGWHMFIEVLDHHQFLLHSFNIFPSSDEDMNADSLQVSAGPPGRICQDRSSSGPCPGSQIPHCLARIVISHDPENTTMNEGQYCFAFGLDAPGCWCTWISPLSHGNSTQPSTGHPHFQRHECRSHLSARKKTYTLDLLFPVKHISRYFLNIN